jgi:hypothetical protein
MSQYCKIYRYTIEEIVSNPELAPIDLNYKTSLISRLHAKRTVTLGEVVQVEWYGEYDGTNFSDLVLKTSISYTRDPMGLAIHRDTIREWYLENESIASPTKITRKWYLGIDRTAELRRRAENAIAAQNTLGLGVIVQDQMTNHGKTQEEAVAIGLGWADKWYDYFENEIIKFYKTNSRIFFDKIQEFQDNPSPPSDMQWAQDTPGFLDTVKAEINFGEWT